jgi:RND superfamily putative drug exporter
VEVEVARDGRTAMVGVPLAATGAAEQRDAVERLRDRVAPTAPGGDALVTGEAARSVDFADRMRSAIPLVIGFVLALAFALLLWAFRSPRLSGSTCSRSAPHSACS